MTHHQSVWIRSNHIWREADGQFGPGFIAVDNGRILALEPPGTVPPPSAAIMDLGDLFVLPGMINTHVHLDFSGLAVPLDDFYAEDPAERLLRAAGNAHRLLMSGVTTARDCGSHWTTLALARRPDLSPVALPRLLMSGPPITIPAGHLHFMEGVVRSDEDILAHIDRVEAEGGRSIKVMASGGAMTPGSDPTRTVFSQESLNLIAREARRRNKPSVSHVLATESITRSARAQIDSLEHCAFYERDDQGRIVRNYNGDVASIVRDSGVSVMANLSTATSALDRMRDNGPVNETEVHSLRQFDIMVHNCGRLFELGVPIVCGSDAGVRETPFDETWLEILWLRRAGLSGAEAIRSATSRSADALLLGDETGRLKPGLSADIIALERDPLAEHDAFKDPALIMLAGAIVHHRRASGRSR